MRPYLILLHSVLFYGFAVGSLYAQNIDLEIEAVTGAYYTNDQIQFNSTLGEVVVSQWSNDDMQLTQGFHQGFFNIEPITLNRQFKNVRVYPNPTYHSISIDLNGIIDNHLSIYLIDGLGRNIFQETLEVNNSKLSRNLSQLPSGLYYLKFISTNLDVQIFKVYKLH